VGERKKPEIKRKTGKCMKREGGASIRESGAGHYPEMRGGGESKEGNAGKTRLI